MRDYIKPTIIEENIELEDIIATSAQQMEYVWFLFDEEESNEAE